MFTILVTGAAGFIGSHTCDLLLTEGYSVVGMDNLRTGRRENLAQAFAKPGFHFVKGDICDRELLEKITSETKFDAIIHLAALVSVPESAEQPDLNFRLNLEATHIVVEAARLRRIPRFVFASSAAVYGEPSQLPLAETATTNPLSPYGGAKLAAEVLLLSHARTYGLVVRCLRYFNVFGPRQDPSSPYSGVISIFFRRMREKAAPTIFGDGTQSRDFVYVKDVARSNLIAATREGIPTGITNVCTGRSTSLNELAVTLGELLPGAPAPLHMPCRLGDIKHSIGSPELAQRELGFVAATSLRAGLDELARGY